MRLGNNAADAYLTYLRDVSKPTYEAIQRLRQVCGKEAAAEFQALYDQAQHPLEKDLKKDPKDLVAQDIVSLKEFEAAMRDIWSTVLVETQKATDLKKRPRNLFEV